MERLLAVDFGRSRIGLAVSEGELSLALEAITCDSNSAATVASIAQERRASLVLVGLPLSLSGAQTESTKAAIKFAHELASSSDIEVRLLDERLTTVAAHSKLRESGKSTREAKLRIDSESAAEILRLAISQIRLGKKPGLGLDEIEH